MLLPQEYKKINRDGLFIDVRSPGEYKQETIPGAINMPIFDDEERKIIGTLYKQESAYEASKVGIEYASKKLLHFFEEIHELKKTNKDITLFCARGGMRSGVISTFINSMGINVSRIKGGYKAYRKVVMEELVELNDSVEYIVIHGNTGVGKTEILKQLKEDGYSVLDLEKAANHRGSLLGSVGLNKCNSQKMFESYIHEELSRNKGGKYVFVEAESRRIGSVFVPEYVHNKMKVGKHIFIDASLEFRSEIIIREYTKNVNYLEEISLALDKLAKYMGKKKAEYYKEKLNEGKIKEVTMELMETYYDPMYTNTSDKYEYELRLTIDDINKAAKDIEKWLDSNYNKIDE
ncbi:tRNA 2-selenouridine(34) synthase MnmH [Oceanirhabdus sp. W0125-5]|uniref:tRNA 2-selenouridine(34) synthase MnmH n=1 Tax=Oceanirhabdus sp. W0125-5 TaxID=2999116 RepID=UPI0022F312C9|nr:tRNA 2-selenouridine(34) synthase MnmH [Oceanirhabdus sp. W0125-5]WBW95500.1 tRNA 2-selenouridine(34) synthase MnmH [Oceanirhabdus sp. W0125-5]